MFYWTSEGLMKKLFVRSCQNLLYSGHCGQQWYYYCQGVPECPTALFEVCLYHDSAEVRKE